MGTLNEYGYQTNLLSAKITELQTLFQNAFGADVNLDLYSPQGQLITYLATMFDNDDKIGLKMFQNMDYHNATGTQLSLLAISKGQPRIDGTKAEITATFTSSASGYTITAGSLFSLTLDSTIEFQTLVDVEITNTSQVVSLQAVNKQQTNAIITDTLTAINNYPSLTDIEILTITDGTNIETDESLIARLDKNDTETGMNDFNAVSDKLNLVENVSRVRVFDNNSSITVNSVPAYTLFCQVVGGDNTAIAQCILDNKATGTPTYGNTTVSTLVDSDGYAKTIYFNRPTLKSIYVKLTLSKRNGLNIDTSNFDTYKQNTLNYINALAIGDDVPLTAIFGFWAAGNYNISALELSFDGVSYVSTDLTIGFTEYAYMAATTQIEIITI